MPFYNTLEKFEQRAKERRCKRETFDLREQYLEQKNIERLAEALRHSHFGRNLEFVLMHNNLTSIGAKKIFEAMESADLPEDTRLNLSCNKIGSTAMKSLAQSLSKGHLKKNLCLNLLFNEIGNSGMKSFFDTFASKGCPDGLTVSLGYNRFDPSVLKHLAKSLNHGKSPKNLALLFSEDKDSDDAMNKEKYKKNHIKALTDVLASGKCSHGLYLAFSNVLWAFKDDEAICSLFSEALKSGNCPPFFRLNLNFLMVHEKFTEQMGNKRAKLFADALASGKCPKGFHLSLSGNCMTEEGTEMLAKSANGWPPGFTLTLENHSFVDKGIKPFAQLFSSGRCPRNLTLNLKDCSLGNKGGIVLIQSLKNKKNNDRLTLNLKANDLEYEFAKAFAKLIKKGDCPDNLAIDLSKNDIPHKGIQAIADALKHRNCPKGLRINLSNNIEHSYDVIASAMIKNTSVMEMGVSPSDDFIEDVIRLCLKRNHILHKYPSHSSYIKQLFAQANLYQPKGSHKNINSNLSSKPISVLPKDIIKAQKELKKFSESWKFEKECSGRVEFAI